MTRACHGPPQVEFQGCGVPSAFAAFGAGRDGDSDDAIDEDEPNDCLSELPTRASHLKMMRVRAACMGMLCTPRLMPGQACPCGCHHADTMLQASYAPLAS